MTTASEGLSAIGIGLILGFFIVMGLSNATGRSPHQLDAKWQKDCVEHNAAHWEVDSSGKAVFKWNVEKQP